MPNGPFLYGDTKIIEKTKEALTLHVPRGYGAQRHDINEFMFYLHNVFRVSYSEYLTMEVRLLKLNHDNVYREFKITPEILSWKKSHAHNIAPRSYSDFTSTCCSVRGVLIGTIFRYQFIFRVESEIYHDLALRCLLG